PHVIGTTGLSDEHLERVEAASHSVPIVRAPNMSVGVNLLREVVREISAKLGEDYDIEVVEAHHNNKKDAPSGTALFLARAAAEGRERDLDEVAVYGREGLSPRQEGEIGIHALRGGAVVGEHRLIFYSGGEEVEVIHRALSRRTFADGALRAARFAADARPGLYSMADVLA
ncbi:MAG: 4-hydroxy-tetrahydrodipicolinate reductase, partial [Rubrobacter sp.]|nr:4-hydroxy-tetrahydrodipicolinate reductase [Rubrobacter sp.]